MQCYRWLYLLITICLFWKAKKSDNAPANTQASNGQNAAKNEWRTTITFSLVWTATRPIDGRGNNGGAAQGCLKQLQEWKRRTRGLSLSR